MVLRDSLELFSALEQLKLLENSPLMWWPAYGTFEVVVGAILTQNTQWSRVQISLDHLRNAKLLHPDSLSQCDSEMIMELIRPSGLYKAKANNLIALSRGLINDFGDFETFSLLVDREWLLSQKGIGPETADSILCYACERPVMVVDSYTARLLHTFGYAFENYHDLQEWCEDGLRKLYNDFELVTLFAYFHGMIVEYVKQNANGKEVIIVPLLNTLERE